METVRRRRLLRGEAHGEVERTLNDAGSLRRLAALALFDDVGRGDDVGERIRREAGDALDETLRHCEDGREVPPAGAVDLVRHASKLTAWLRGIA
jgi:hypothetical protein